MNDVAAKPRRSIAVVSPFLDKRHGTERATVECFARLAEHYDIHLYSQSVEDLDITKIHWHRIPTLPGPHILNYSWWFAANHLRRWYDRIFRNLRPDVIFSPGVNCFDADIVHVHIVFAEFVRLVRSELKLRRAPVKLWPRLLHRRLYYWLIVSLERVVYRQRDTSLAVISQKVVADLDRGYARHDGISVVYYGIDPKQFSPQRVAALREGARRTLGVKSDEFAILLVGNDWKKKGLSCLIDAISRISEPKLRLLVAGRDDTVPFSKAISENGLEKRVQFLPPRSDVEFYYAACDLYVGPSLEDAFSLPPAEAMACGIPVITSREAGVSEIITHELDGMILEDPTDSVGLAQMIRTLYERPEFRHEMGRAAVSTASHYTWERNAAEIRNLIEQVLARKDSRHNATGEAS